MNIEDKTKLIASKVTLNGKLASISGPETKFALVRSLDGRYQGEWSWDACKQVIDKKGGHFLL
jgi:hypothetical protein